MIRLKVNKIVYIFQQRKRRERDLTILTVKITLMTSSVKWIIVNRTFSNTEEIIPSHAAEGMMERMVILHDMVAEIGKNLLRNGLNRLRRNDIVETAMIEHHRDFYLTGQVGLKFDQVQGRGEKDQLPDGQGVPAGINGRHESAITGSDQDQIGFVLQQVIQFVHAPIHGADKILEDHVGIFTPEKFALCTMACAFKAVDKYPCQEHGDHLCVENGRSDIAFPLL
jgi:hypothetical protein